jgi:hypothetical protein
MAMSPVSCKILKGHTLILKPLLFQSNVGVALLPFKGNNMAKQRTAEVMDRNIS